MNKFIRFLKLFERFLILLIFLSFFYILFCLFVQKEKSVVFENPQTDPGSNDGDVSDVKFSFSERSVSSVESRDFFTSVKSTESQVQDAGLSTRKDHKIVGILIGPPAQIVIENKVNHKTLFLLEGQTQDDISLQSVDKSQIRLKYKGVLLTIKLNGNSFEF